MAGRITLISLRNIYFFHHLEMSLGLELLLTSVAKYDLELPGMYRTFLFTLLVTLLPTLKWLHLFVDCICEWPLCLLVICSSSLLQHIQILFLLQDNHILLSQVFFLFSQ